MKTLVVGYGNPIRSDDSVGLFLADELETLRLPEVTIQTAQQLDLEWIEDFATFTRVVLLDASIKGPDFQIREIDPEAASGFSSSHHLEPETLLRLAKVLGTRRPRLFLCTVRGEHFGFGETLSPATRQRAESALPALEQLIFERN